MSQEIIPEHWLVYSRSSRSSRWFVHGYFNLETAQFLKEKSERQGYIAIIRRVPAGPVPIDEIVT